MTSRPVPDLTPLRFLLATVAGFVNREQARAIAYLVEENRVLREQLGQHRLRLNDDRAAAWPRRANSLAEYSWARSPPS